MSAPPVGVRPPVIRREERRRRLLLFGIVAALLLAITPVVGHHVLGAVPWLSSEQHHFGMLCLVTLHHLLEPIHGFAHWLLYAGAVYAIVERGEVVWRHRRAMLALRQLRVSPQSALGRAAVEAGLGPGQLRTVRGLPMPAFTSGWLSVRVVVAADLHERLTHDELVAVLAHEAVHLRRRDPLRLFALRTLASLLFWLPVLRRLAADLEDEVEITADDQVPPHLALALASAVLSLGGGTAPISGTVGFQRADLLPRRIRRLAGEDATPVTHTSLRSLAVASVALVLAWSSGLMVLHPLSDATGDARHGPAHCDHPLTSPLTHLFCQGWSFAGGVRVCPHEGAPATTGEAPRTSS